MRTIGIIAVAALLAGCQRSGPGPPANEQGVPAEPSGGMATEPSWDLQSSAEGTALVLLGGGEAAVVRLFCPAGAHRLLVNVPAFQPVGSEERLSFGSGGQATALVADSRGDPKRGGVSATAPVPGNLAALIGGPVAVNYGSQNSGPHPAPPAQTARAFAAACSEAPPAQPPPSHPDGTPTADTAAGPCRMQDGKVIPPNLIKAVGTEPFWAARIEGRCVTYSHPENQSGTRIWTQFTGSRDHGVWTGFYENKRFVLRTRRAPGCSDGMSDRRYPLAVTLSVAGEERTGCAEWL